jgi:hypothetical protein
MKITRTSAVSGITRTLDLPIIPQEWNNYEKGMHIQDAFTNLTAGEREFIKTGITDEEWDNLFMD